jgi:ABC-type nickel/cobalt efflux system permease component RcnA
LVEWAEWVDPDRGLKELLADLVRGRTGIWLGMCIAFLYGVAHAFAPGHGKAVVGAYLIGTRGRILDAVWLGVIVTLAHTLSIIIVAILVGFVFEVTDRAAIDRWIAIGSGVGILGMGLWLLWRNTRAAITGQPVFGHHHHHHAHHGHDHDHDHGHDHGHHHHGHDHRLPASFRELLALGVTGGIVPCAGGVWVFLWALNNDYAWTATLMVSSFSLGLAAVLVAIGLLMVTSTKGIERIAGSRERVRVILFVLPFLSALIIVGVGVVLTYMALGW